MEKRRDETEEKQERQREELTSPGPEAWVALRPPKGLNRRVNSPEASAAKQLRLWWQCGPKHSQEGQLGAMPSLTTTPFEHPKL